MTKTCSTCRGTRTFGTLTTYDRDGQPIRKAKRPCPDCTTRRPS